MYLKRVPIPTLTGVQETLLRLLGLLITRIRRNTPEAALPSVSFLEEVTDACVMECYFREHMEERDLLFLDDLAPHLKDYDPDSSEAKQRDFLGYFDRTLNAKGSKIRDRLDRITKDSPDLLAVIKEEAKV